MSSSNPSKTLTAIWMIAVLSGCVTAPPKKPAVPPAIPAVQSNYWQGDGVKGPARIVISLGEQRAYFYRGKKLVGETVVSTGRSGFETPAGSYRVIEKDRDHVSSLYGAFVDDEGNVVESNVNSSKDTPPPGTTFRGAKMPHFLRFHAGYGLHGGRVPSHRASHGCVRLPRNMATHFYENATTGTPVILRE